MSESVRRHWFQLHRATLVAVALTAGLIGLLNQHTWLFSDEDINTPRYGWPMTIKQFPSPIERWIDKEADNAPEYKINRLALVVDSAVGLTILLVAVFIIERIARSKHRFYLRIHLSTALLLIIAANVLVWMNSRVNNTKLLQETREAEIKAIEAEDQLVIFDFLESDRQCPEYGWPISAFSPSQGLTQKPQLSVKRIAMDAVFAIAVLSMIAFLSEWVILYREARKP